MISREVEILNAVFTPMHDDESIDYNRIPDLFQHCIQTGAQGIFLNGSTGECMSLSLEERLQLVETWIQYRRQINRQDFKIIVHVGSCNLFESAQMAQQAQALGADGIAMVSTFYFRPDTLEDLMQQCEYVAKEASHTPFYYYNIPGLTGVNYSIIKFLEMASGRIPNFAGLKNSFSNIEEYKKCLTIAKEKYSLYWGDDENFMLIYTMGNRHYVGSTYNYMNGLYQKILKAHLAGDSTNALTLGGEIDAIFKVMSQYNGISVGKEIMRFIGVDCGPVRKPLKKFTKAESEELFQKLNKTILFQESTQHNNSVSV